MEKLFDQMDYVFEANACAPKCTDTCRDECVDTCRGTCSGGFQAHIY